MKNYIWILLLTLTVFSCSTTKDVTKKEEGPDYSIEQTPLVYESDTFYLNELRFYKIQSAMDGMKLMYDNYGTWDKKIGGKHQENVNRIIWQNVRLLDDNAETFTVIADGTETRTEYFACLIVFDSEGKDCFKAGHPNREALTKILVNKMRKIDENSSNYHLFR